MAAEYLLHLAMSFKDFSWANAFLGGRQRESNSTVYHFRLLN